MSDEQLDLIFQDYLMDMKDPCLQWKKDRFMQSSYSRWAVQELLTFVKQHKDMKPINAIELFIHKMDEYACANSKNSYIFSVAHDIAEDIYDIFLAMIIEN